MQASGPDRSLSVMMSSVTTVMMASVTIVTDNICDDGLCDNRDRAPHSADQ